MSLRSRGGCAGQRSGKCIGIKNIIYVSRYRLFIVLVVIIPSGDLRYSDFKGKPEPDVTIAARTYWELKFHSEGYDSSSVYSVTPVFDSKRSFIRIKEPWVLEHENYHWLLVKKISERTNHLFAGYQNKPYSDKPGLIFDSLSNQLKVMEEQYDSDTRHGNDRKNQVAWEDRIRLLY